MDPVTALRQIAYYKDRNRHDPRRVMAYRNAADIIEGLDDAARQRHGQANSWQSLAGIGPKTAKVIAQAWSGREPDLLAELRADAEDLGGGAIRAALRGDLHLHSNWSDGSAPIEEMMATAAALGHQYCALTDHSPRLTIANGLSPDRLRKQLDVIDELREKFAPLCRLLNYMDDNGFDTVVVERPGSDVEERPFMEFTPGYVLRSLDELPKQGSRTPWRLNQNYLRDIRLIRRGKIDDEGLRFAKRPAPVGV
ncbi:PHP domain-containing protein [Mycobacterium tuberculosis]|nr:PHP domain-containing protein [Mycobacterium tuberculosis]RES44839.1 PHP domain-containing protein [Mycobacterium tuberculosis]RES51648.1 PHP domain-containing protein [Mycobacterium tuberculosis]